MITRLIVDKAIDVAVYVLIDDEIKVMEGDEIMITMNLEEACACE